MSYQPKSYRKFLATSVAATLVATAVAPVAGVAAESTPVFTDVESDMYYTEAVEKMAEAEFIKGLTEGVFGTNNELQRRDAVLLFSRIFDWDLENVEETTFEDLGSDATYHAAIAKAVELGIINGRDSKTFDPRGNLNRGEMAALLTRALELEVDEDYTTPFTDLNEYGGAYANYIKAIYKAGLTTGQSDTLFGTGADVKRADFATFLYRDDNVKQIVADKIEELKEDDGDVTTELAVESVSAINGSTYNFTVTLNEAVSSSELQGETVTLTRGDVVVTGEFVSVSGKDVTFSVKASDRTKMENGAYAVTSTFFSGSASASFVRDVVDASTSVRGVVLDKDGDAFGGVTVKVGNKTALTDEYGYYVVEATAGATEVEFSADGYFTQTQTVDVRRNNSTVKFVDMVEKKKENIFIESNVVDNKTGAGVEDAVVTLQVRNSDGEFVDVASVDTEEETGYFAFSNGGNGIELLDASGDDNTVELEGSDQLDFDAEYRIVVEKDILDADGEFRSFEDNYETLETSTFQVEQDKPKTAHLLRLTPLRAIDEFFLNVNWAEEATIEGVEDVTVTLIHPNGETILGEVEGEDFEGVREGNQRTLKDDLPLRLVNGEFFGTDVKPQLPVGTYYLKVDDGEANNGVAIIPVEVTSAKEITPAKTAEINQAAIAQVSGSLSERMYANAFKDLKELQDEDTIKLIDLYNGDDTNSRGVKEVKAQAKAYIDINGVKVLVASTDDADVIYNAVEGDTGGQGTVTTSFEDEVLERLPGGSFVFEISGSEDEEEGNYITSASATSTLTPGGQVSPAIGFKAAGEVTSQIDFSDSASDVDVTIELIDNASGEVAYTFEETLDNGDDFVGDAIAPGRYKVQVSASGYETYTSFNSFQLVDFHELDLGTIELEAIQDATVTGFVRKVDAGFEAVADNTKVIAYTTDEDGDIVVVGEDDITDGYYEIEIDKDYIGETITFVARGAGDFETAVLERQIVAGENEALNFEVNNGGKGQFDVVIYDELERPVDFEDGDVYLRDAFDKVTWATWNVARDEDEGYFELDSTNTAETNFTTGVALSEGVYELVIRETDDTEAYSQFITIGKNQTVSGGIVLVDLKPDAAGAIRFDVSGTVTGFGDNGAATATAEREVVAIDESGRVVAKAAVDADDDTYTLSLRGNNSKYTLAALVDGAFVGFQDVTVQDHDRTNVNFSVSEATR